MVGICPLTASGPVSTANAIIAAAEIPSFLMLSPFSGGYYPSDTVELTFPPMRHFCTGTPQPSRDTRIDPRTENELPILRPLADHFRFAINLRQQFPITRRQPDFR